MLGSYYLSTEMICLISMDLNNLNVCINCQKCTLFILNINIAWLGWDKIFTYHKSGKLGLYPNIFVMQAKYEYIFRVKRNLFCRKRCLECMGLLKFLFCLLAEM